MNGWLTVQAGRCALASAWVASAAIGVCAQPVQFTSGHLDLRIAYQTEQTPALTIGIADEDAGIHVPASEAVLIVDQSARMELPVDLPPLGSTGTPVWVLPQTQDPGLLFLGISAEGVPAGIFEGPLQVHLKAVEGPGEFFLWQADLGGLSFHMDSSDGLAAADMYPQTAGGHSHANWGFGSNGVYRIGFQVVGVRAGDQPPVESPLTVVTFHVQPLPTAPHPHQQWLTRFWPGVQDETITGADADPDHDSRRNLEEYVSGTDPTRPDNPSEAFPRILRLPEDAGRQTLQTVVVVPSDRTDVRLRLESAAELSGPWTDHGEPSWSEPFTADGQSFRRGSWISQNPSADVARFQRVAIELTP